MSPPTEIREEKRERLVALDVCRGLAILAMILVNNPGSWDHVYPPLRHADWHGFTPTDLIFPSFLFIVGTAMPYSLPNRYLTGVDPFRLWRRVAVRSALLIGLGIALNGVDRVFAVLLTTGGQLDASTLRLPGVLQRIGIAYAAAAPVVVYSRTRAWVYASAALLIVYALLLGCLPPGSTIAERYSPEGNVVRKVDLAVLGADHLYTRSTVEPTDPEGLLSTLPSVATVLIGAVAGRLTKDSVVKAPRRLAWTGVALVAAGLFVDSMGIAINKKLWTSSFALLTAGLNALILAACLLVFDGGGATWRRRLAAPFQLVGVNAIFVYVGSWIAAVFLGMASIWSQWDMRTPQVALCELASSLCGGDPYLASLLYAVCFASAWWLVLAVLWKFGWSFRL